MRGTPDLVTGDRGRPPAPDDLEEDGDRALGEAAHAAVQHGDAEDEEAGVLREDSDLSRDEYSVKNAQKICFDNGK